MMFPCDEVFLSHQVNQWMWPTLPVQDCLSPLYC
jgi:hypothetical protein